MSIRRFKAESLDDSRFFNNKNLSVSAEQAKRIAEEQRKLEEEGRNVLALNSTVENKKKSGSKPAARCGNVN
jgi:hypothetical protein